MNIFKIFLYLFLIIVSSTVYSQFHNYKVKYGVQGHVLVPSTEFDTELYRLSILGRGFVRVEESSIFEGELGVGIGKLNGIDYSFSNWSTTLLISDLRLIFSPFSSKIVNPYLYSGVGLLNWNVTELPKIGSPKKTSDNGWDLTIPVGAGIEIKLSNDILFDFSGHYTFAMTDDLNYFNNPTAKDGYFDIGFGLTFVMGSQENDDDDDGLSNSFELEIKTDPHDFDTDGDGLKDGEEINYYKTNPLLLDGDYDGIEDYEEVIIYKTDPNSSDSDGDDLSDFDEINKYFTNPNIKDSDKDKLNDGDEINYYKTNPTNSDTDGDGVSDGDEIFINKTDPLISNVDKRDELIIDPKPNISPNATEILGITFDSGSSIIKTASEIDLIKTLNELKNNPALRIEVSGYTDNVGNQYSNKKLSQNRADAVRIWLVKKGIDALRIEANGYGSINPIADNNTKEGRIKNRRIEILKK